MPRLSELAGGAGGDGAALNLSDSSVRAMAKAFADAMGPLMQGRGGGGGSAGTGGGWSSPHAPGGAMSPTTQGARMPGWMGNLASQMPTYANVGGMMIGGPAGMAIGGAQMLGRSIQGGFDFATRMGNVYQNRDLSAAQKENAFQESLPIIGAWNRSMREFREMIDGTTERLRRLQLSFEVAQAANPAVHRGEVEARRRSGEVDLANARRVALAGAQPAQMPTGIDETTAGGRIRYQEELSRLPLRQAADEAVRGVQSARAAERIARRQLDDFEASYAARQGQLRRAGAQFNRRFGTAGAPRDSTLGAAQRQSEVASELVRMDEERLRLIDRVRDAAVGAANAEAAARRANIAVMQNELQIQEQRLRRTEGAARRIGSMNSIDADLGVGAVRRIREVGMENVSEEERRYARSVAPEWMDAQEMNHGEGRRQFQELRGMLGDDFAAPGSLREQRDQRDRTRAEVNVQMILNEQTLAEQIVTAMERSVAPAIRALEQAVENIRINVRTDQQRRNAASPTGG